MPMHAPKKKKKSPLNPIPPPVSNNPKMIARNKNKNAPQRGMSHGTC